METKWKLIKTDGTIEEFENDMKKDPGYHLLRGILAPLLNFGHTEHVAVLADFDITGVHYRALDMFVDEDGLAKNLPRNEIATTIYRRATMMEKSGYPKPDNPEELSFVVGPAVLFNRRVWY